MGRFAKKGLRCIQHPAELRGARLAGHKKTQSVAFREVLPKSPKERIKQGYGANY